jgi:hypothetical protein
LFHFHHCLFGCSLAADHFDAGLYNFDPTKMARDRMETNQQLFS